MRDACRVIAVCCFLASLLAAAQQTTDPDGLSGDSR